MTLTTVQHSALAELRRHGSLYPEKRAFDPHTGRRLFAKRTLQALVDAGLATWSPSKTWVEPVYANVSRFGTGYMDQALDDLSGVISQARKDLAHVDFDTLVGTGFSGGVVIPALALALKKNFVLIRKETDDSHHGSGRLLGTLGERWVFVDDFVSSGSTRRRVISKVEEAASWDGHRTTHVGDYLYANSPQVGRWSPTIVLYRVNQVPA